MIYALATALRARLVAIGCPVPVAYGPERTTAMSHTTRIVVERMRGQDEAIKAPTSRPTNPKMLCAQEIHGRIRIFAASTAAGSGVHTHERLADLVKRTVLVQIQRQVQVDKQTMQWLSGSMPAASDLELDGLQSWPGVVYDLHFSIDEGAFDLTWADALSTALGAGEAVLGTDFDVSPPSLIVGQQGTSARLSLTTAVFPGSLTFTDSGRVITRASGSFVDDGFADGDLISVLGTASNNVVHALASDVADLTITLASEDLDDEGPVVCRLEGTPALTFARTGSTITRSRGSWVTEGFTGGAAVHVAGTVNNDVATATIATVSALVLTLTNHTLTDETVAANRTVIVSQSAPGD